MFIGLDDILDLAPINDQLLILGDSDDNVFATGFTDTGTTQTIDGVTFDVYTSGSAEEELLIQQGITVV